MQSLNLTTRPTSFPPLARSVSFGQTAPNRRNAREKDFRTTEPPKAAKVAKVAEKADNNNGGGREPYGRDHRCVCGSRSCSAGTETPGGGQTTALPAETPHCLPSRPRQSDALSAPSEVPVKPSMALSLTEGEGGCSFTEKSPPSPFPPWSL